jgi:hypothetical protein
VTLPVDAFYPQLRCGGHRDLNHILTADGFELSVDVCCCRPDACCRWPMLLLHFGLFLPDHAIGSYQRAHPDGFQPLGLL